MQLLLVLKYLECYYVFSLMVEALKYHTEGPSTQFLYYLISIVDVLSILIEILTVLSIVTVVHDFILSIIRLNKHLLSLDVAIKIVDCLKLLNFLSLILTQLLIIELVCFLTCNGECSRTQPLLLLLVRDLAIWIG